MDIYCTICNEPWDSYGVDHGDMAPWEAKLFRQGAGCPCCEGNGDVGEKEFSHMSNGDQDEIERIHAYETALSDKRVKWEKPENPVFWQCDACGVQAIGDIELPEIDEHYLQYNLPHDAPAAKWYNSHPFWRSNPDKEPAHVFSDGRKVCEYCLSHCAHCGTEVSSVLEHDDMYDDSYCSGLEPYGYQDVFCIDCIESSCSDCNCLPDDCDCHEDEETD